MAVQIKIKEKIKNDRVMEKVLITKESALNRFKKAIEHKQEVKSSIEKEFASKGKIANVVFL